MIASRLKLIFSGENLMSVVCFFNSRIEIQTAKKSPVIIKYWSYGLNAFDKIVMQILINNGWQHHMTPFLRKCADKILFQILNGRYK